MTPEDHNKYVGYTHLGYGIFSMIFWLGITLFYAIVFGLIFSVDPELNNNPMPIAFVILICSMIFLFASLLSLPSIIAGYGHLKKKSWAKIWSLIAAFLSASNFPFGTAVAVYSLWFNFGDAGKEFYKEEKNINLYNAPRGLNAQTANWSTNKTEEFTEKDFVNLSQPPNWRE